MPKKLSIYIGLGTMVNLVHLSNKLCNAGHNFTLNKGIGCWKDEVSGELYNEEQATFTFLCLHDEEDAILAICTEYLQTCTLELCLAYDLIECRVGFKDTQLVLADRQAEEFKVNPEQINPGLLRKPVAYNPWLRSKMEVNDSTIPTIN